METTTRIIEDLQEKVKEQKIKEASLCRELLKDSIKEQMRVEEDAYDFENKKSVIFHDLKNGFGAGTTELHIVRVLQNSLNAHYILWNLKTNNFIADGVNDFSGAVGQKRIGREFIANYLLAIPPRVQQDMIVKTIDDAFAAITEIEKSSATIQRS